MDLLDEKPDAPAAPAADAPASGGDKAAAASLADGAGKAVTPPATQAADAGKGKPPAPEKKAPDAPAGKAAAADDGDEEGDDDALGFGDDKDDGEAKAPATWPDDWRQKLAGEDEKWLKELGRYTSFDTWAKAQRALRQKLSSGEYKRAKPADDASDEEKAQWRKENGVPDKPEDYGLPEVKGHTWSDADKATANSFLADMHAAGAPKEVAHKALGWYAGLQQKAAEMRAETDRADTEAREDALRAEWGPSDYRPNIRLAKQMLNDDEFISPALRSALAVARTPDGHRLILHPELTRFLAERGLEKRGPGALISGEQSNRMQSREAEIRKIMATDIDRYYAEGLDTELAEITSKMESRR